jgi:hypothetical protein
MAVCYWHQCDCPTNQPCTEHKGLGCSNLNGVTITSDIQVQDANTAGGEAAIAQLSDDKQKLTQLKTQMEARKAEIERDKADLDAAFRNASDRAERRAAIDQSEALAKKYEHLNNELLKVMDQITAMGAGAKLAVSRMSSRLIIPYAATGGYCTCYQRKQQVLAAIASQLAAEQAHHGVLLTQHNTYTAQIFPDLKFTFTTASGFIIFMFVFFGIEVVPVSILVTQLVIVLILIAMIIDVMNMQADLLDSETKIARLTLGYYRIQQIPVCTLAPVPVDGAAPAAGSEEESWWDMVWKSLWGE